MMRLFLASLVAAGLFVREGAATQLATFRASQDVVPVYVTVTDASGRLVSTLAAESFQIFDNGQRQTVTVFDNTPQPVHLVVMLDVSGSMFGNLQLLRTACQDLFGQLAPEDLARVGLFGKEVSISPSFSRNIAELTAALPSEIDPLALTPLWFGLDQALTALHDVAGRRVVVVLSDGKDNPPRAVSGGIVRQADIVTRARRDDVMIYGIGLLSAIVPGSRVSVMPDPGLSVAALETGGGYFPISPTDKNLSASFAQLATEVHSQYLLGFSPQLRDGQVHPIEVRLTTPALAARARKSYEAPAN